MSEIRHVALAPTEVRRLSTGEDVEPHRHDEHQLIYASTGVLEVFVPEGTWYTPAVRAVWVPAGAPHHWRVHGTTTVHMIGFPKTMKPTKGQVPALVAVDALLRELIIACSNQGPAKTAAGQRLLHVLVDRVQFSDELPTVLPSLKDDRLRDVQQVLESDMSTSMSLTEVGRKVGASERTLSRLFAREVGMGYTAWRTQLRLHQAVLLLTEGKSVTETATACGFSSPSAFVNTFRSAFGRTPGALYQT